MTSKATRRIYYKTRDPNVEESEEMEEEESNEWDQPSKTYVYTKATGTGSERQGTTTRSLIYLPKKATAGGKIENMSKVKEYTYENEYTDSPESDSSGHQRETRRGYHTLPTEDERKAYYYQEKERQADDDRMKKSYLYHYGLVAAREYYHRKIQRDGKIMVKDQSGTGKIRALTTQGRLKEGAYDSEEGNLRPKKVYVSSSPGVAKYSDENEDSVDDERGGAIKFYRRLREAKPEGVDKVAYLQNWWRKNRKEGDAAQTVQGNKNGGRIDLDEEGKQILVEKTKPLNDEESESKSEIIKEKVASEEEGKVPEEEENEQEETEVKRRRVRRKKVQEEEESKEEKEPEEEIEKEEPEEKILRVRRKKITEEKEEEGESKEEEAEEKEQEEEPEDKKVRKKITEKEEKEPSKEEKEAEEEEIEQETKKVRVITKKVTKEEPAKKEEAVEDELEQDEEPTKKVIVRGKKVTKEEEGEKEPAKKEKEAEEEEIEQETKNVRVIKKKVTEEEPAKKEEAVEDELELDEEPTKKVIVRGKKVTKEEEGEKEPSKEEKEAEEEEIEQLEQEAKKVRIIKKKAPKEEDLEQEDIVPEAKKRRIIKKKATEEEKPEEKIIADDFIGEGEEGESQREEKYGKLRKGKKKGPNETETDEERLQSAKEIVLESWKNDNQICQEKSLNFENEYEKPRKDWSKLVKENEELLKKIKNYEKELNEKKRSAPKFNFSEAFRHLKNHNNLVNGKDLFIDKALINPADFSSGDEKPEEKLKEKPNFNIGDAILHLRNHNKITNGKDLFATCEQAAPEEENYLKELLLRMRPKDNKLKSYMKWKSNSEEPEIEEEEFDFNAKEADLNKPVKEELKENDVFSESVGAEPKEENYLKELLLRIKPKDNKQKPYMTWKSNSEEPEVEEEEIKAKVPEDKENYIKELLLRMKPKDNKMKSYMKWKSNSEEPEIEEEEEDPIKQLLLRMKPKDNKTKAYKEWEENAEEPEITDEYEESPIVRGFISGRPLTSKWNANNQIQSMRTNIEAEEPEWEPMEVFTEDIGNKQEKVLEETPVFAEKDGETPNESNPMKDLLLRLKPKDNMKKPFSRWNINSMTQPGEEEINPLKDILLRLKPKDDKTKPLMEWKMNSLEPDVYDYEESPVFNEKIGVQQQLRSKGPVLEKDLVFADQIGQAKNENPIKDLLLRLKPKNNKTKAFKEWEDNTQEPDIEENILKDLLLRLKPKNNKTKAFKEWDDNTQEPDIEQNPLKDLLLRLKPNNNKTKAYKEWEDNTQEPDAIPVEGTKLFTESIGNKKEPVLEKNLVFADQIGETKNENPMKDLLLRLRPKNNKTKAYKEWEDNTLEPDVEESLINKWNNSNSVQNVAMTIEPEEPDFEIEEAFTEDIGKAKTENPIKDILLRAKPKNNKAKAYRTWDDNTQEPDIGESPLKDLLLRLKPNDNKAKAYKTWDDNTQEPDIEESPIKNLLLRLKSKDNKAKAYRTWDDNTQEPDIGESPLKDLLLRLKPNDNKAKAYKTWDDNTQEPEVEENLLKELLLRLKPNDNKTKAYRTWEDNTQEPEVIPVEETNVFSEKLGEPAKEENPIKQILLRAKPKNNKTKAYRTWDDNTQEPEVYEKYTIQNINMTLESEDPELDIEEAFSEDIGKAKTENPIKNILLRAKPKNNKTKAYKTWDDNTQEPDVEESPIKNLLLRLKPNDNKNKAYRTWDDNTQEPDVEENLLKELLLRLKPNDNKTKAYRTWQDNSQEPDVDENLLKELLLRLKPNDNKTKAYRTWEDNTQEPDVIPVEETNVFSEKIGETVKNIGATVQDEENPLKEILLRAKPKNNKTKAYRTLEDNTQEPDVYEKYTIQNINMILESKGPELDIEEAFSEDIGKTKTENPIKDILLRAKPKNNKTKAYRTWDDNTQEPDVGESPLKDLLLRLKPNDNKAKAYKTWDDNTQEPDVEENLLKELLLRLKPNNNKTKAYRTWEDNTQEPEVISVDETNVFSEKIGETVKQEIKGTFKEEENPIKQILLRSKPKNNKTKAYRTLEDNTQEPDVIPVEGTNVFSEKIGETVKEENPIKQVLLRAKPKNNKTKAYRRLEDNTQEPDVIPVDDTQVFAESIVNQKVPVLEDILAFAEQIGQKEEKIKGIYKASSFDNLEISNIRVGFDSHPKEYDIYPEESFEIFTDKLEYLRNKAKKYQKERISGEAQAEEIILEESPILFNEDIGKVIEKQPFEITNLIDEIVPESKEIPEYEESPLKVLSIGEKPKARPIEEISLFNESLGQAKKVELSEQNLFNEYTGNKKEVELKPVSLFTEEQGEKILKELQKEKAYDDEFGHPKEQPNYEQLNIFKDDIGEVKKPALEKASLFSEENGEKAKPAPLEKQSVFTDEEGVIEPEQLDKQEVFEDEIGEAKQPTLEKQSIFSEAEGIKGKQQLEQQPAYEDDTGEMPPMNRLRAANKRKKGEEYETENFSDNFEGLQCNEEKCFCKCHENEEKNKKDTYLMHALKMNITKKIQNKNEEEVGVEDIYSGTTKNKKKSFLKKYMKIKETQSHIEQESQPSEIKELRAVNRRKPLENPFPILPTKKTTHKIQLREEALDNTNW